MSSTLTEPPPPQRRRFAALPRLSKKPEVRSVQVGVLATIFVHLFLLLIVPIMMKSELPGPRPEPTPPEFSVELGAPDPVEPPKEKPPMKFVETNPDTPENVPDKTDNFGAQNQQVAQEKPTPDSKSDRPATEGDKDIKSTQIVDGQLKQPQMEQAPIPPADPTPPAEQKDAAKKEQSPLSGTEKMLGESADAIGTNVAKESPHPEDVPEKIDGVKDAPLVQNAVTNHLQIDPRKPQPRQTITRNVRPAVFQENKIGTMNVGLAAYDAKWSNYGQYLQKLIEAVQLRWDDLISSSKHYPQQGSTVSVTFTLNSAGRVEAIVKVDGTADKLATSWCVSAISPNEGFTYGPWTDDMIALLGTTQELGFNFLYR